MEMVVQWSISLIMGPCRMETSCLQVQRSRFCVLQSRRYGLASQLHNDDMQPLLDEIAAFKSWSDR